MTLTIKPSKETKMDFEFVEFYPAVRPKKKEFLGTVHIYAIDCELDIRGINVILKGKSMFFNLPHCRAIDERSGVEVRYPHLRWTNEARNRLLIDFLHKQVKPEIFKRLKNSKSKQQGVQ